MLLAPPHHVARSGGGKRRISLQLALRHPWPFRQGRCRPFSRCSAPALEPTIGREDQVIAMATTTHKARRTAHLRALMKWGEMVSYAWRIISGRPPVVAGMSILDSPLDYGIGTTTATRGGMTVR